MKIFKFLKDKLKGAVKKFSKDVEESAEDVEIPEEDVVEVSEQESVVEELVDKEPVVDEPAAEEPAAEEPVVKEQVIEEPVAEEAVEDTAEEPDEDISEEPKEELEEKPAEKSEAEPEPKPEAEPEPKPEAEPEAEPEGAVESTPEKEVVAPVDIADPILAGIRDTLEGYSNEDLDELIKIGRIYSKSDRKDDKIKLLLSLPVEKIDDILEKFSDEIVDEPEEELDNIDDVNDVGGSESSEEELDEEAPDPEQVLEEGSADDVSEDETPKKGFFGRLFGRKKKDDEPEEEPSSEVEEERDVESEEAPKETDDVPEEPVEDGSETESEKGESLPEGMDEEAPEVPAVEDVSAPEEKSEDRLAEVISEERADTFEDVSVVDRKIEESGDELKKDSEDFKRSVAEDADEEESAVEEPKRRGFFGKVKEAVSGKKLSESKFEDIFFELEVVLLENNVALEVIEKIKQDLKEGLVDKKLNRFEIEKIIMKTLKSSLKEILSIEHVDILSKISGREGTRPFVMAFVGINGSGKTTTIAKVARYLMDNNLKTVLVASDTFRAAAIQQLEEHADRLGVKMIKHDYGSDPAAVAFDGIKYAESKGLDVVLIDTAGRLHSNANLMDEMKKIIRVASPDMKIFIGESITGNDCVEQAQKFNEAIGLDGIILSKADVDEKGGAALSVSYVTGKPILFLGTGQEYSDIEPFDKDKILKNLGL